MVVESAAIENRCFKLVNRNLILYRCVITHPQVKMINIFTRSAENLRPVELSKITLTLVILQSLMTS